jgi:ribonuclease Y
MNPVNIAGIAVIVILAAAVVVLLLKRQEGSRKAAEAEEQARVILDRAREEGDKIKREAELAAREKDLARLNEFEAQNREKQRKINETERRLLSKEENLERRFQSIERKERDLAQKERKLTQKEKDLEVEEAKIAEAVKKGLEELERISGLTQEEAKAMLIKKIEDEAKLEAIATVRRIEEEAREKAAQSAREIMANAIQRSAAEHVVETTVSVVDLPSEDMKGRIIGREGRNIRALEMATGVDIIVDDTPEAVILSSFDPIRRELARLSIQKLVTDGRIHPARIEDIVESVKADLEQKIKQEGESAVLELKVRDIHPELIKLLGKLKYRTSYGQNVLQHTKEVAMLAAMMAREIGLDTNVALRACSTTSARPSTATSRGRTPSSASSWPRSTASRNGSSRPSPRTTATSTSRRSRPSSSRPPTRSRPPGPGPGASCWRPTSSGWRSSRRSPARSRACPRPSPCRPAARSASSSRPSRSQTTRPPCWPRRRRPRSRPSSTIRARSKSPSSGR